MTEIPDKLVSPQFPRQDRLLFHRRIHDEFEYLHEQGFPALKWDSARPRNGGGGVEVATSHHER